VLGTLDLNPEPEPSTIALGLGLEFGCDRSLSSRASCSSTLVKVVKTDTVGINKQRHEIGGQQVVEQTEFSTQGSATGSLKRLGGE